MLITLLLGCYLLDGISLNSAGDKTISALCGRGTLKADHLEGR